METQLFAYQREELRLTEQEKHYNQLAKKTAKAQWIESLNGKPKRQVKYTTFIKITADSLYAGEECKQFMN